MAPDPDRGIPTLRREEGRRAPGEAPRALALLRAGGEGKAGHAHHGSPLRERSARVADLSQVGPKRAVLGSAAIARSARAMGSELGLVFCGRRAGGLTRSSAGVPVRGPFRGATRGAPVADARPIRSGAPRQPRPGSGLSPTILASHARSPRKRAGGGEADPAPPTALHGASPHGSGERDDRDLRSLLPLQTDDSLRPSTRIAGSAAARLRSLPPVSRGNAARARADRHASVGGSDLFRSRASTPLRQRARGAVRTRVSTGGSRLGPDPRAGASRERATI